MKGNTDTNAAINPAAYVEGVTRLRNLAAALVERLDSVSGDNILQALIQLMTDQSISADMQAYRTACDPRLILRMCDNMLSTGAHEEGNDIAEALASIGVALSKKGPGAQFESVVASMSEDGHAHYLIQAREIGCEEAQARAEGTWKREGQAEADSQPADTLH